MFDINAFIENQRKLSIASRSNNTEKSKSTKKLTSKCEVSSFITKECKNKSDVNESLQDSTSKVCLLENSSPSDHFSSDEEYKPSGDEEYEPSDDEEFDHEYKKTAQSKGKKLPIKKYVDDGNVKHFEARMKQWRERKHLTMKIIEGFVENGDTSCDEDFYVINGGLKIPNVIWKKLYKYQKTGVKWLWELHQIQSGGLLGDEMGLGKTVQIIAFLAGLSVSKGGLWNGLGPSIIVAPATILHQWVQHFHEWWPPLRIAVLHNSGSYIGTPESLVKDMYNQHGIIVTTYVGAVQYKSLFESRKWHYVILDEGHRIRNIDTQVSKAVRKLHTPHRIVVTGSPMQNNLQELWSIFDFMSPGLLGTLQAFIENFANPITQGGYANASRLQEMSALSLATTLKKVITPYMLRRTKYEVKGYLKLPEKDEQVLFCSLSNEQKDLYKSFLLSNTVRSILDKEYNFGESYRAKVLVALTTLRKICNHPDLYIYEFDDDIDEEVSVNNEFGFWKRAGKMVVINSLLKIWKKQGHRALIFTQSRAMICVLEIFLQQNNYKYLKMDGSISIGSRQPLVSLFNNDESYLVFLATTRVGGLGVNLTGADRVIIYDPDWNPAIDSQAKERAWRIGQNRNVTIYRLLSAGTVEEKIYQRQVFKHLLANKVFLDPNQKNYLKTSCMQGLFSFEEPDQGGSTETTSIFQHTKIDIKKPNTYDGDVHLLNGGFSFSQTKLNAMRRLAQQISKKLCSSSEDSNKVNQDDPRERYKRKRLPSPSPPELPAVNTFHDQLTGEDFSTVMSEIDVINMYNTKPEPCDFLTVDCNKEENENIVYDDANKITHNVQCISELTKPCTSKSNVKIDEIKKKRKRKNCLDDFIKEEGLSGDLEFSNNVQRIKKKKTKKEKSNITDTDQYVLGKLFSKGVQSVLQHDKVVCLKEGEERKKLETVAQRQALRALKNLKKSRLKKWRW